MTDLVVHGHFYQPPRENPWTELIDRQPTAAPFTDWNARVADECYERMGQAALRSPQGQVAALVNLFSWISFNVGPTLAAWLERERPGVLEAARAGEAAARRRTGAVGALMQPYGHPILPLCVPRERRLQLAWGRADFERRFGTGPRGIWLPECAVDLPTLEDCADAGLAYTIVAPEQIARVRLGTTSEWTAATRDTVDTSRPYRLQLPSGRSFTLFVFNGPLSRGAAFSGLLSGDGEGFLAAAEQAAAKSTVAQPLVLLAADGETFGHHQRAAEEVLAAVLQRARLTGRLRITHLGELAAAAGTPPDEATLVEPSSWSCPHGVGRWSSDCGCGFVTGGHPWREPLRRAMNLLRDRVFALIDRQGGEIFPDPWATLGRFGQVVVAPPRAAAIDDFLTGELQSSSTEQRRRRAALLLELTRQTLFAGTSCGWFFDDIAGIEATQVLRHAARACELTRQLFAVDPEPDMRATLRAARSQREEAGSGEDVYERQALSSRPTAPGVAARYAIRRAPLLIAPAPSTLQAESALHVGAYRIDERSMPARYEDGAATAVTFELSVTHERTEEPVDTGVRLLVRGPFDPIEVSGLSGEPIALDRPGEDELLSLRMARAERAIPALDPARVEALAQLAGDGDRLAVGLPPPLGGMLVGAIRSDLSRASQPSAPLQALLTALGLARLASLNAVQLEPERPKVTQRLAAWTDRLLATPAGSDEATLREALTEARQLLGDRALAPVWAVMRAHATDGQAIARELLEAAGLDRSALTTDDIVMPSADSSPPDTIV